MRIGVSLRSSYDTDDVRASARWMVERAAAARAAELDSLFLGDHHVQRTPYHQGVPMLGRLLAEWGAAPAGALFLLPLWHPVLLAEQVGTLAAIAQGRFVIQCALGDGQAQFAGMGADRRRRPSTFESVLDVVRRLLAGEAVDADHPVAIRGARIAPLPPGPVEVWIGAGAPVSIDRAARLGDGWLAGPGLAQPEAAEQLVRYRAARAALGGSPGVAVIRRDVHVGASSADARRVAGPVVDRGYRGMAPDVPVAGSVEEVVDAFGRLAELGYEEVLVRHLADDQADVLASFERLAEVRRRLA